MKSKVFSLFITSTVLSVGVIISALPLFAIPMQEITGKTGGKVNSGDCGYISSQPNHIINLSQKSYKLNVRLQASGGKPTLLIIGPKSNDRFCILGDVGAGKLPEMKGVWTAGQYKIYVGEAEGAEFPFTLTITDK
ncbi:MAG: hypothetical protein IGQ45_01945 [Cyanobacterium sp. T60_A2020_053]|nr:hypothetical protein [Cyanobacterium sp. T60_A2020_053]